jgi:tryptophan-rich sensory protein
MYVFGVAGTICIVAAALEWLCAGKLIGKRLAELRWPRYSPSLGVWILIGGAYYIICFVVWIRLLELPRSPWRTAALTLAGSVQGINAIWNLFFFRVRHFFQAFICGMFYTEVATALLLVLAQIDGIAALWFLPYSVYLAYANLWGWRIWKLNSGDAGS